MGFVDQVGMHLGQARGFFGQSGRGRDPDQVDLTPYSKAMRKRLTSSADQMPELAGLNDLQGTAYTLREIKNWKATALPEQVAEFDRQRAEAVADFGRAGLTLPYWDSLWILRTFQGLPDLNVPEPRRPQKIGIGRLPRFAFSAAATSQWEVDLVELLGLSAGTAPAPDVHAPVGYRVPTFVLKVVAAVVLLALTATLALRWSVRTAPDTISATILPPRALSRSVPPPPVENSATDRTLAPQGASQSAKPAVNLATPAPVESAQPKLPQNTRTATVSADRPADQPDRAPVAPRREVRHPAASGLRQASREPARPVPPVLVARSASAKAVPAPNARIEAEVSATLPRDQSRPPAVAPVGATAMLAIAPAPADAPQVLAVREPNREASRRPQKRSPAYREVDGIDAIRSLRRQ